MKKQLSALAAALTLTTALAGPTFAGDPSQWGTRRVNEYEGQHRVVTTPEAAKKGSFDITAGGTRPNEDVPVIPGIASQDPEYPVTPNLAGGKDPEVPTTPG